MQIPAAHDPVAEIESKFADAALYVKTFRDEITVVVKAEKLVDILLYLRNTPGLVYNFLSDISAVDYYPEDYGAGYDGNGSDFRPERYGVSYHLYSMLYNRRLRIKAFATDASPTLPSITPNFPAANWLEREIMDLMGIMFAGHPDPRRLLMPEDWDGHPHRRDYPVGKETVAFSFNTDEINKHKPFADK
jgi:NADH-quinone oxidoreductase subunit C